MRWFFGGLKILFSFWVTAAEYWGRRVFGRWRTLSSDKICARGKYNNLPGG